MTFHRYLLFLGVTIAAFAQEAPVRTTEGPLIGSATDGVHAYKGIPYAAPPVGTLRWKPPQPVTPWKEPRSATVFSNICPQPGPRGAGLAGATTKQDEDCLYLNVWTAAQKPGEKRPVMLWIHGGGFQAGSAIHPFYEGSNLARQGAVVVTVGYRLGALGFLALPALSAESERHVSGNDGILDLIAALQWVHPNAGAFGGDPGNVTIFGQSGGSWGVCYLMASPLAKGLFHRGIGESGCTFDRDPHLREKALDYEPAEKQGEAYAVRVGGDGATLETLRAKPAAEVSKFVAYTANIDGYVLPRDLYSIFTDNQQSPIPVLGGNVADEGTLTTRAMGEQTASTYDAYVKQLRKTYGDLADDLIKQYRLNGPSDVRRATEEIFRDSRQVWEMRELVRLTRRAKHPAYLYYFTRVPPGESAERMGAFHAAEIPYVFGNMKDPRRAYTGVDHKLSEMISAYWLNFARTGNPNGAGLPEWPMFELLNERCLELGDVVKVAPAPNKAAIDIFDRYEAPRLAKSK